MITFHQSYTGVTFSQRVDSLQRWRKALVVSVFSFVSLASSQAGVITFDLAGVGMSNAGQTVDLSLSGGEGKVVGVAWNLAVTAYGSSWPSEVAIELISPGATPNTAQVSTNAGRYPELPSRPGTFVWATPGGVTLTPNVHLNWPSSSGASPLVAGSTTALNDLSAEGIWLLRLFDKYQDSGQQFTFNTGSFISITYELPPDLPEPPLDAVPEPSVLAVGLLTFLGAFLWRRKFISPSAPAGSVRAGRG